MDAKTECIHQQTSVTTHGPYSKSPSHWECKKGWRESKEAWKPMGSPKSVSIALMCHHTLDMHLRLLSSHDPSGLLLRSLTLFCNLWFQLEHTLTLQRKNRGYNKKETLWRYYGARKRYDSSFRMNSVFSMCNFLKEVMFLIICTESRHHLCLLLPFINQSVIHLLCAKVTFTRLTTTSPNNWVITPQHPLPSPTVSCLKAGQASKGTLSVHLLGITSLENHSKLCKT